MNKKEDVQVSNDLQDIIALAESYFALANAHASNGRWSDAIKAYKLAIELESSNPSFYEGIGLALQRMDKPVDAEQAFKKAIEIKSNYLDAYISLSTLYKEQGRILEAEEINKVHNKLLKKTKEQVTSYPLKSRKLSTPSPGSTSTKHAIGESIVKQQHASDPATSISQPTPSIDKAIISSDDAYKDMQATNRSNGLMFLIFGIINIVFQSLSTPLGILMLAMSVFWFFIQTVAMNVVASTVLFWVALNNLLVLLNGQPRTLSDQIVIVIFSLVAFVSGFNALKEFLNFRKQRLTSFHQIQGTSSSSRDVFGSPSLAVLFPIIGLFISLSSLGGFIISAFLWFRESTNNSDFGIFMLVFFLFMAPFGFGWGLASLLSSYRLKPFSIIGMIASGLVIIGWFGLLNL